MLMKILGASLIIAVCGGFGFRLAAAQKSDMRCLKSLISLLDYMECELNYRLTPLPTLCRQAAREHTKTLGSLFLRFADTLDSQICADAGACMAVALQDFPSLPQGTSTCLRQLGATLGSYGLVGQLKGLSAARAECRRMYDVLDSNKDARLRSYQVLGICAGAALAIVLI